MHSSRQVGTSGPELSIPALPPGGVRRYPGAIQNVRGLGMMIGMELVPNIAALPGDTSKSQAVRFTNLLHDAGLLVIPAGTQILRLLPALNLRRSEAEEGLGVLDRHFLAGRPFLCGDAMTIADLQAAEFVALGEHVGSTYADHPNLRRWLARMKALPSWTKVHGVIDGYAATLDRAAMQGV